MFSITQYKARLLGIILKGDWFLISTQLGYNAFSNPTWQGPPGFYFISWSLWVRTVLWVSKFFLSEHAMLVVLCWVGLGWVFFLVMSHGCWFFNKRFSVTEGNPSKGSFGFNSDKFWENCQNSRKTIPWSEFLCDWMQPDPHPTTLPLQPHPSIHPCFFHYLFEQSPAPSPHYPPP